MGVLGARQDGYLYHNGGSKFTWLLSSCFEGFVKGGIRVFTASFLTRARKALERAEAWYLDVDAL